MSFNTDASGAPVSVRSRSLTANTATVTVQTENGKAVTADISVAGQLADGSTVPGAVGLLVDPATANSALVSASSADAFLGQVEVGGRDYVLGGYGVRQGNVLYAGFGMAGNESPNVPTVGSAIYSGEAAGFVVGDVTGVDAVTSRLSLTARFAPGGGTVSGLATNMVNANGVRIPIDVRFDQANISGSKFEGGKLGLQSPTNGAAIGQVVSSDYQGAFYGDRAAEAAGTYQIEATGVPIVGGGGQTQRIQSIGAFGAAR